MFNKKKIIKEIHNTENLYHKLLSGLSGYENDYFFRNIPQLIPEIEIEHMAFYSRESQVLDKRKGIFLTTNKEVGLLEIQNTDSLHHSYYIIYYAYLSTNGLEIQKKYLERLAPKRESTLESYSMDMDTHYSLKKKIEKLNHDLPRGKMRKLAKQLLRQKVRRF